MSSIRETAERICRHNLDSERVSVTQFCDIQAAIEKALRDERERATKIIEDHQAQDKCEDNCWTTIKATIRKDEG